MKRKAIHVVRWAIGVEAVALAGLLIAPGILAARTRHQATETAAELKRVITAAKFALARTGEWPADAGVGRMPESLKPFLAVPVQFEQARYQIDWDHWKLSDGKEDFSKTAEFVAVSIVTPDARLARDVVDAMGHEQMHFTVGDRVTFVIAEPQGLSQ